jgi:hypothetical protein
MQTNCGMLRNAALRSLGQGHRICILATYPQRRKINNQSQAFHSASQRRPDTKCRLCLHGYKCLHWPGPSLAWKGRRNESKTGCTATSDLGDKNGTQVEARLKAHLSARSRLSPGCALYRHHKIEDSTMMIASLKLDCREPFCTSNRAKSP